MVLAAAAIGLRELVNASAYQLFGDWMARVDTTDLVVALTFDDGPHPQNTPRVLEALDRHGVKATFFMMGRNVERHPDIARLVRERGHEIGNHSYSHLKMVFMSRARMREEIARTDELLRGIGATGDVAFRPPHLSKFIGLPLVLREMGKLSVLADVDAEEWRRRPAAAMTESILRQVRPGSIVLLHDTAGAATLETLEAVLAALEQRGYRFETIADLAKRR